MPSSSSLKTILLFAAFLSCHGCTAAIVDPSCGLCQEVSRPVHCPPVFGRTNCLDGFSSKTWYACPHRWRHCCPPVCSFPGRRQSFAGASDVFAVPAN
jgi:hypothetical protein